MRGAGFLFLLSLFFLGDTGRTQVLFGTVTDENEERMGRVKVENRALNLKTTSSRFGNFYLKVKPGDLIYLSHIGYETDSFVVPSGRDTIRHFFQLKPKTRDLGDLSISSNRLTSVLDRKGVNVLDYVPYKNFTLALFSYKREKFLSLEAPDSTIKSFPLNEINGKSLFEDCYGNIHLLSKDSSYQIYLGADMAIVARSSMDEFNELLEPCVAAFDDKVVFEKFTNHNKLYSLYLIEKEFQNKLMMKVWDEDAEKVAQQEYMAIIALYYKSVPIQANIIEQGAWDGNMIALAENDTLNRMISWYLKIRAREIEIQSFQVYNKVVSFDFLNDSIYVYNQSGDLKKTMPYLRKKGPRKFKIILDKWNNTFYVLGIRKGVYSLNKLDLSSGDQETIFSLDEVVFAENIQVFDNWVYFLRSNNGFHKLYRIQLKD